MAWNSLEHHWHLEQDIHPFLHWGANRNGSCWDISPVVVTFKGSDEKWLKFDGALPHHVWHFMIFGWFLCLNIRRYTINTMECLWYIPKPGIQKPLLEFQNTIPKESLVICNLATKRQHFPLIPWFLQQYTPETTSLYTSSLDVTRYQQKENCLVDESVVVTRMKQQHPKETKNQTATEAGKKNVRGAFNSEWVFVLVGFNQNGAMIHVGIVPHLLMAQKSGDCSQLRAWESPSIFALSLGFC